MSTVSTMFHLLKKGDKLGLKKALGDKINSSWVSKAIPDKLYLRIMHNLMVGENLNLRAPKTFNEKLQWLKLYNRRHEYQRMVDKYEVKQYVSNIIGSQYVIPTLGIWNSFDEIDFDKLPNQFVLKCTHDSGSVVICKDKSTFDVKKARDKINKGMRNDLFWYGREWPYKGLKRRVLAEEYMEDTSTKELRDYKFFCFHGQVKCCKVDFDRFIEHHANYYDTEKNILKIGECICPPDFEREIEMPNSLDEMKKLAEMLSKNIPFLRADFYDANGQVYFGELTFYPASGLGRFISKENDEQLGKWLKLPEQSGGGTAS